MFKKKCTAMCSKKRVKLCVPKSAKIKMIHCKYLYLQWIILIGKKGEIIKMTFCNVVNMEIAYFFVAD